ncbi:glycosyltransferase [Acinetobacter faecalis]|uniref:Glycosyltransferase n=1 Tax=Acinetobacter faecalis TaxID=2665161 RepID=A0AB35UTP1_9GAMM|nr:glycosyltransferase [Acinetobacter faecalis]MDY6485770.1 glycosyltransferase [Acinetobacter faecalis]
MIPKVIHYCWFGEKDIPKAQLEFIKTWHKYCPDWEFKLWNEKTFDVTKFKYTESAYNQKKYAFVSDYVRVWALNTYGGVYLDTDVELKQNIECFLECDAFSCVERIGIPFTSAVWGSVASHELLQMLLNYYNDRVYTKSEQPNTVIISDILEKKFNINKFTDSNQIGQLESSKICIYSSDYFCLDLPHSYATHHFFDSWSDTKKEYSYKSYVHDLYYLNQMSGVRINNRILKEISKKISLKDIFRMLRWWIKYK